MGSEFCAYSLSRGQFTPGLGGWPALLASVAGSCQKGSEMRAAKQTVLSLLLSQQLKIVFGKGQSVDG